MTGDELIEDAIETWRINKGTGTAIIPKDLNDKVLIYQILCKLYARSPTCGTLIITNNFNERLELIEFLTHQDEENDAEFKKLLEGKFIKIYTASYVNDRIEYIRKLYPYFCIAYKLDDLSEACEKVIKYSHFKLVVLNKLFKDNETNARLFNICPVLDTFKQAQIEQVRMSTPVEEMYVPIDIDHDSEDYKLYQYYTEYITTSINIFGSFDIIKQARIGNSALNISSAAICYQIATENGWNENLDMSNQYNRDIDEIYNPNSLKERASQIYEIIRNRTQLVSSYKGKLEKILDIVRENKDKKILIISKKGEFASTITDYLNNLSENVICGNYHDKVDDVPGTDVNGNPIYIKSGVKAGERRMFGSKAQKSLNQNLFNLDKINVISTNASPDKDLAIAVDIIIITSPLCESIESYMYRLSKVTFNNNSIKLYSLFCKGTIEESQLENKEVSDHHLIVNKDEIDATNENNSTFFIVD